MRITLQELVKITGRTRRTIYDWIDKGLPREADGSFDLAKFIQWFEKYIKNKMPPRVIEKTNIIQQKKAELLDVKIEQEKIKLKKLKGE